MNKKLSRLIQPSMGLYFILMVLFAASAFLLEQYYLAAAEGGVTVLAFLYFKLASYRRRKDIAAYIQTATTTLETAAHGQTPFPMVLLKVGSGEIVWTNDLFNEMTGLKDSIFTRTIADFFPALSLDWLKEGKLESPTPAELQGRRYRVLGNLMSEPESSNDLLLCNLYFLDVTELERVRQEYTWSRPVVSIILIDNYDELTNNLPDSNISNLNAAIDAKIKYWTDSLNGLLRKIERNRYLFIFESRYLPGLIQQKFSLLDSVREVVSPAGISATISLGVGKDGASYAESYSFASLGIEMALARGGDQAVIKDRYNFSFYGGHAKETDRRTKVKSRVMASSLCELITQSSHVFIMGHKNADLDSVGAAAGIQCICRKLGKMAHLVIDLEENASKNLLERLGKLPEYRGCFITGQNALLLADPKSLLVVVDTNRPDQVEYKPLLECISRVCVIDHHRRAADYIEQVVLNHHEPFASSASELVTELLQYAADSRDILPLEAQALLAGIMLDTKNFCVRTGSRTFEAAAFLRRLGADTVDVKKLLQNDLQSTISRYEIIKAAKLYRGSFAVASLEYTSNRTIAAQAADELLSISGVACSFVLYPTQNQIIISARSLGDINVQVILEPLGGGGNAATAGAQITGKDMDSVLEELVQSIDKYLDN